MKLHVSLLILMCLWSLVDVGIPGLYLKFLNFPNSNDLSNIHLAHIHNYVLNHQLNVPPGLPPSYYKVSLAILEISQPIIVHLLQLILLLFNSISITFILDPIWTLFNGILKSLAPVLLPHLPNKTLVQAGSSIWNIFLSFSHGHQSFRSLLRGCCKHR